MNGLGVVIVAAGRGSRMGTAESKQYLLLEGKPILVHTLEVFEQMKEVDAVVLVVGEGDEERCRKLLEDYSLHKVTAIVTGGAERQASVFRGLRALPEDMSWVMVHDGVRPFAESEDILACWEEARKSGAAVLAMPVKDTIKVVDADGTIRSTPDRRSLWAIQTPQAFRLSLLLDAHERAERDGFTGTDDAMLAERINHPVKVVAGSYRNIKITTPDDLEWAKAFLNNGGGNGQ